MGLGFYQNIAADGAGYLSGTVRIILVGVAAVGAVADGHGNGLDICIRMVGIAHHLPGDGVGALVLCGRNTCRPCTAIQLILHGAALGFTCGDQFLSLAGVGQCLSSGGLGHNRSCFLNAPVQLDFAGVVAGTLNSQHIGANIGCLISDYSISDTLGNRDGLSLLLAGVGKASIQFHICLGDSLGIDGQVCAGVGD